MISIICGDAMECIADIEDDSIDLVVLDPDYQDWKSLCEKGIICEAVRVLKPEGNILCFTKQPFDYDLRCEVDHLMRREMVWTFENGGAWVSNRMPLVSYQKIYWLTAGENFFFNARTGEQYSENTRDFKRSSKVFGGYEGEGREFEKSEEGVWLRDHLHINKPQTGSLPSKPQKLMDIYTMCFCPEGGKILDPFAGSGNLAESARKHNCDYIGFEIDPERARAIEERFSQMQIWEML